jgi:hypothetical protein
MRNGDEIMKEGGRRRLVVDTRDWTVFFYYFIILFSV